MPCQKISNANDKVYFRTDFSYIRPAIQLIDSYVTWLNITKEITFVFTNQNGKYNYKITIVFKYL